MNYSCLPNPDGSLKGSKTQISPNKQIKVPKNLLFCIF